MADDKPGTVKPAEKQAKIQPLSGAVAANLMDGIPMNEAAKDNLRKLVDKLNEVVERVNQ